MGSVCYSIRLCPMKRYFPSVFKMKQSDQKPKFRWRAGLASLLLGQALALGTPVIAQEAQEEEGLTYGELLEKVERNRVEKFILDPETNRAKVTLVGQSEEEAEVIQLLSNNTELLEALRENNIDFEVVPSQDNSVAIALFTNLLLIFVLVGGLVMIIRRTANAQNNAMSFGKSRARFQMDADTGVKFDDVAGVEEAKEELGEVVTFLKEPNKFTAIGATIPRGMLLIGPPGTGKTLLAKAIAGEAGVPFFSISGSEFVEMFVGVGASRVRDLFRKAQENAPCLIFIDEIDAVGRQRGAGIGGGNDEREQTLNQLLTEMDGFEKNSGVIVIAATNRPDVLDRALLRPGRFDRQVTVDYPDYNGRVQILDVHARDKKIADDIDLKVIARRTPGFAGADLANLLNEAAIFAVRRRKEEIGMSEINEAIDRVIAGMEGLPIADSKKKRLLAYHEIGHALVATLNPHHAPLQKVTLIRRGRALGAAWYLPDEEMGLETRQEILADIESAIAGRAAEMVIFGHDEVTAGATSDIEKVTSLARQMVTKLGMSKLGQFALEKNGGEVFLRNNWQNTPPEYSEQIASAIDEEIRQIAFAALENAKQILQENRALMDKLVDLLVEQETLDGDEFRRIVAEETGNSIVLEKQAIA